MSGFDPTTGDIARDVENNIRTAHHYASSTIEQATQFLETLNDIINSLKDIPYIKEPGIKIPGTTPEVEFPDEPTPPDIGDFPEIKIPDYEPKELEGIDSPNFPNIPDFHETAPTKPYINFDVTFPEAPQLNSITIPEPPDIQLPEPPTVREIQPPDVPTIEYIDIGNVTPPDINMQDIEPNINYTEEEYKSKLKDVLTDKIVNTITKGGTALPKEIEQAIFEREKERSDYQLQEDIKKVIDVWTSRGFSLPIGMMQAEIEKILLDYQHSRLDISRDIAIKQAELEQQNIHSAISEGVKLEEANMQFANEVRNRAYKIAVSLAEFAVNIYNAKLSMLNTLLERYKAILQANELKLRSNLSKVEVYKSLIESKKLEGEIEQQKIQTYISLIEGVKAQISMYNSRVEALKSIAQINLSKTELFRTQVQAFTERLNAESKKIDLYNSEINAYRSKVEAYKSRVDAVAVKTQAEVSKVDAQLKLNENTIQNNRFELEQTRMQAELQLKQLEAKLERLKGKMQVYAYETQGYSSIVNAKSEKFKAEVEKQKLINDVYKQNALLALEQAKTNLMAFVESVKVQEAAAQGGAQVYASLVNGALNSINTAVTLGAKLIQTESLNVNV